MGERRKRPFDWGADWEQGFAEQERGDKKNLSHVKRENTSKRNGGNPEGIEKFKS